MSPEFTKKIQQSIIEAKDAARALKDEKVKQDKIKAEEEERKRQEEIERKILCVIGALPEKIKLAGAKGLNYVDIPIDISDMQGNFSGSYTGPKPNSITDLVHKTLEKTAGIYVQIRDDITTETGAYGEEYRYHNFYFRITF